MAASLALRDFGLQGGAAGELGAEGDADPAVVNDELGDLLVLQLRGLGNPLVYQVELAVAGQNSVKDPGQEQAFSRLQEITTQLDDPVPLQVGVQLVRMRAIVAFDDQVFEDLAVVHQRELFEMDHDPQPAVLEIEPNWIVVRKGDKDI